MNQKELEIVESREKSADIFFEDYDFGSDYPVTDFDAGWNKDGIFWSKMVYGDTPEGERWAGSFGIQFENESSDQIIDDWLEVV
jgi:hypothetical protein